MTRFLVGAALSLGLLAGTSSAWAQIYRCVDGEGHVTYSNVSTKGCKRMELDPISSVPSGRSGGSSAKPASANPSPGDFPKVSNDAQKARDNDRRTILEQELASEKKSLEQAKKELADQEAVRTGDERNYQKVLDRLQPYKDKVAMHERNIQAISKELGNLK